jgi:hypothetical protein
MPFEPQNWTADQFLGRAEGGRTRPLRLGCSRPLDDAASGRETAEFFTKVIGLPEIREQALFAELVGNALAREYSIKTPEPAFVEVTRDFAQVLQAVARLNVSPGVGVGARNLGPELTPPTFGRMSDEQVHQAARIYIFDLAVQNPDRRRDNANCLVVARDLVAIDFESCFSFLYPIVGIKSEPWQVSDGGIPVRHLFHAVLKGADLEWQRLCEEIGRLVDAIDEWAVWLPNRWSSWADQLRTHMMAIRDHQQQFLVEVLRSLG